MTDKKTCLSSHRVSLAQTQSGNPICSPESTCNNSDLEFCGEAFRALTGACIQNLGIEPDGFQILSFPRGFYYHPTRASNAIDFFNEQLPGGSFSQFALNTFSNIGTTIATNSAQVVLTTILSVILFTLILYTLIIILLLISGIIDPIIAFVFFIIGLELAIVAASIAATEITQAGSIIVNDITNEVSDIPDILRCAITSGICCYSTGGTCCCPDGNGSGTCKNEFILPPVNGCSCPLPDDERPPFCIRP
jgi:hypothetical protein